MSADITAKFSTRFALLIAVAWILTSAAASADPPEVSEDNPKYVYLRLEVGESGTIEAGPDPYAEDGKPPYADGEKVYHLDRDLFSPVVQNAVVEPNNGVASAASTPNAVTITGRQVGFTTVYIKNRYTVGFRKPAPPFPRVGEARSQWKQGLAYWFRNRNDPELTEDRERTVFVTVYAKVAQAGNFNAGPENQGAGTVGGSEELEQDGQETPPEDSNPNSGEDSEEDTRVGQTPANGAGTGYLYDLVAVQDGLIPDPYYPPVLPYPTRDDRHYRAQVPFWEFINAGNSHNANHVPRRGQMPPLHQQNSQTAEQPHTPAAPNGNSSPAGETETAPLTNANSWQNSRLGNRAEVQVGGVESQPRLSAYFNQQGSRVGNRTEVQVGVAEPQLRTGADLSGKALLVVGPQARVIDTLR